VDVGSEIPARFAAYRPAPNPFARGVQLRFDLPLAPAGRWPVEVAVYNVAGRKVRTLVQADLEPGAYAYAWDGRDEGGVTMAAGIYFVRIRAGTNEARERVVYLP
jgi:hypothetical protein